MKRFHIGLLTSVGLTLDSFFPEIVQAWRREDVLVSTAAGTASIHLADTRQIPSVSRAPSWRNVRAPFELARWADDAGVDVVITNTANASALSRMGTLRVPVIYFCHGLHWDRPTLRTVPFRLAETALLRNTAGVITLNSDDETWFRRRTRSVPIIRLQSGVGLNVASYPRSPQPALDGRAQLLWVGEFSRRKNPEAALDILESILAAGLPANLTMLGDGPLMATTKSSAAKRGLASHIAFAGRTPPRTHFERAHAVVHTAHWEGLPRVLIEALAIGRPIFGFDVKGVRDIPAIKLSPPGDTHGYAQQVITELEGRRDFYAPPPEDLSSETAAAQILAFARATIDGRLG